MVTTPIDFASGSPRGSIMADSLWSVRLPSGQQLDNQSTADLKALVASGQLGPEDMVYRDGLNDWVKARKLKGLFPASNTTTQAHEAQVPTPASSAPPGTRPAADEKPRKLMPQIIIGFLIFIVVLMVLKFVTGMHFVLGVLAGLIVIGGAGAATFVILFKADMLPEHFKPKLRVAMSPLIAIALAGLIGTMAAIAVPRLEREAAADARERAALLAQAESAYEEGRLGDARDLAEDALYHGSTLDSDPNRDSARRLIERIERDLAARQENKITTENPHTDGIDRSDSTLAEQDGAETQDDPTHSNPPDTATIYPPLSISTSDFLASISSITNAEPREYETTQQFLHVDGPRVAVVCHEIYIDENFRPTTMEEQARSPGGILATNYIRLYSVGEELIGAWITISVSSNTDNATQPERVRQFLDHTTRVLTGSSNPSIISTMHRTYVERSLGNTGHLTQDYSGVHVDLQCGAGGQGRIAELYNVFIARQPEIKGE